VLKRYEDTDACDRIADVPANIAAEVSGFTHAVMQEDVMQARCPGNALVAHVTRSLRNPQSKQHKGTHQRALRVVPSVWPVFLNSASCDTYSMVKT
jgi:hypothetical protein